MGKITSDRIKTEQASDAPLDFNGDDGQSTIVPDQARDVDGVPYCRKHHCRMKVVSGAAKSKGKDYYACPVDGCAETGVRIRTKIESVVPPTPLACARCSTADSPSYCERDPKRSTTAGVVLVCPRCGWNGGMHAVPQLELARLAGHEKRIEMVGDR